MSDAGRGEPRVPGDDADVLAIRALIAENAATSVGEVAMRRIEPDARMRPRPVEDRPASGSSFAEPARHMEEARPAPQPGFVARLWQLMLSKIKAYRPNAKTILGTSLVLLLLLHPIAFIGWCIVAVILALALYLIIGEERFWRGAVAAHARYARRNPDAARRLKIRARLAARRWDRWVAWLPDGMADTLRSPDVRALVLAETRHDAILTDRLSRLGQEQAQR